jgi:small-conductance mechanosensitive channel
MNRLKKYLLFVLALLLLIGFVAASYLTRDAKPVAESGTRQASPVDESLLQTARSLMPFAETSEEQSLWNEAVLLADHELDQEFASAIRQAEAAGPPGSGPLKQLSDQIQNIRDRLRADQVVVDKLTPEVATSNSASDQLDVAKAQLTLDQDELDNAQDDLASAGGDLHAKLERLLQAHEAVDHISRAQKFGWAGPANTLAEQARSWFGLRANQNRIEAARQQALEKTSALSRTHEAIQSLLQHRSSTVLTELRQLSDQRKTLTSLDKRIQDSQQIAGVYQRWSAELSARFRNIEHRLLVSGAIILVIVLVVLAIDRGIRMAFAAREDRRRLHAKKVLATIVVQVVGALIVLLVIFGPPNQISAIIGLTTAGLTVALKDFIVAFFGWFVLLGKDGIHIGDWVEIEGVGGEVIEIGMLRTVLLEMGEWNHTGHPTGRHVSFVNKFALENHYFNFSTEGRWLWDRLDMTLPATGDPYQIAMKIREHIEQTTQEDARAAESEWERVTHKYGTKPFSAKPAVDLHPSANGLEVSVRYITRAPRRYEVKSRLFSEIVEMMRNPAEAPAPS